MALPENSQIDNVILGGPPFKSCITGEQLLLLGLASGEERLIITQLDLCALGT